MVESARARPATAACAIGLRYIRIVRTPAAYHARAKEAPAHRSEGFAVEDINGKGQDIQLLDAA